MPGGWLLLGVNVPGAAPASHACRSRGAVESRRLPSRVNWASAPSSGRKTSATAKQDPVEAEAEGTLLMQRAHSSCSNRLFR